jgi:polysaccharide export outer membrane protein
VALLVAVALAGPAGAQGTRPGAEYRIGPKDVLRITVFGHEDLTRSVTVAPDGSVPFPLVGSLPAAGSTPADLEGRLRDLLGKDYLVDPQVSVSVQEYRSQRVFVLGEAEKPGTYALTGRVTLVDVLSQAGGAGKAAGRQLIVVRAPRSEGPLAPGAAGTTSLRVNLRRLLEGDAAENIVLQDGDTIYIPKVTSVFVLGEVTKPGAFALDKDTTPLEVVTLAGGFTDRAAPAGARILRRRGDGSQEQIEVDLGGTDVRARDLYLVEGDTVVVPRGNSFFVSGEVARPGAYQLERSTTAFSAVTVAGGFTDKAARSQVKVIRRLPSGEEQTVALDLGSGGSGGSGDGQARDFPLRDGDTVLVPAGNTFYVLGEVKKPGAYQVGAGTSAVAAITTAGGFTEKSNQGQVKLTRRLPSGEEQVTLLDLSGADPRAREFLLRDGDILLVATGNTFYVLGEVKKPGAYQLDQSMTAIQAIATAGGFTERAAPNRTRIIRTHRDGRQETLYVNLNDVIKGGQRDKDVPLTSNDVLVVPESFF